ncbi:hypothetical protein FKG59_22330 [Salmonella enterica]|nr:hypothetical protein [Salmonella enterica]
MGSCAAPSAKGDDKFITTDYLQQCRFKYTLVSGPHGPLTRRYAPTSGKPSSGPLRPRTEALS